MKKQRMRVDVCAPVESVAVVEVAVEHQHFELLQLLQRFFTILLASIHDITRRADSLMYTTRPPTIVPATPPRSCQPSNGVFFDLDFMFAATTVTARSGARIVTSAAAPSSSDPPGTLRILAGLRESSSMRRGSDTMPLCTSRSKHNDTAVSRPVMPNGALSNSTCFSSAACGAWSVAMTSMLPSARPSSMASRSAPSRSGGFIFVLVSYGT